MLTSKHEILSIHMQLLPSEAIHQRDLYWDISDITNHSTDIYYYVP